MERGQLILWKDHLFELLMSMATKKSITTVLKIIGSREIFCVTNVYGPPIVDDRIQFFNTIRKTNDELPYPHKIIGGDFNMILNLSE